MASKNVYQKLGYRIAGEVQLLAEEKWIIETISKIKKQRNSLQIERLHLESLKSQLRSGSTSESNKTDSNAEEMVATTSAVDLMQNANIGNTGAFVDSKMPGSSYDNNETTCNYEELNLRVTGSIFNENPQEIDFCIEEDESDVDESDNIMIDINMLMNGCAQPNNDF